jgi:hypothetical protein
MTKKHIGQGVGGGPKPIPLEKRFWSKVKKTKSCWLWTASTNIQGYGKIGIGYRGQGFVAAHRLSWEIHNGPIPKGMCVLHKCDNPLCVNPSHLWLGTNTDNLKDMAKKRRSCIGEKNARAKLTQKQVDKIRTLYKKPINGISNRFGRNHRKIFMKNLAEMFHVSVPTIHLIITNKHWTI